MSEDLGNGYGGGSGSGANGEQGSASATTAAGPLLHTLGTGSASLAAMTDKGGESLDGVCRDYMRNVCRRGASCKFRHPDNFEAEELGKQIEYVFCHDFQVRS